MAAPPACERHPTYIREMMERLGIEPGGGAAPSLGLSYATAFHRCEACPSKHACREWLDGMPRSVSFAPRFCPNADILFELEVNQPSLNHTRSHVDSDHVAKIMLILLTLNGLKVRSMRFCFKTRLMI